ncbi:MAG: hypothetical protein CND43_01000 [Flavobacteriales bacterium MED-G15]|nr:MAG: hypothetical protein CND43_01000 [Flavobacteriales bacterium MED-G15]
MLIFYKLEIINYKLFQMKKLLFVLIVLSTTFSFAQEITGKTRTGDKYSVAVSKTIKEYLKNQFVTFENSHADDANFNLNGKMFEKNEVKDGWSMHHQIYSDIKVPMMFVETTFYDENNNNQVWSHLWGRWEGTSKRTGKVWKNPFNASFKWVDGKIVQAVWVYDPTSEMEEMAALQ